MWNAESRPRIGEYSLNQSHYYDSGLRIKASHFRFQCHSDNCFCFLSEDPLEIGWDYCVYLKNSDFWKLYNSNCPWSTDTNKKLSLSNINNSGIRTLQVTWSMDNCVPNLKSKQTSITVKNYDFHSSFLSFSLKYLHGLNWISSGEINRYYLEGHKK